MTPMFSAYVVVGDPPTEVATTVPTPSAKTARPSTGSRSRLVISPTAFTWPAFSAISAMTAGSTSTKNPAYRDVLYVEELIGPDTVNTLPPATIEAFRDHGRAELTLEEGVDDARDTLRRLAEA